MCGGESGLKRFWDRLGFFFPSSFENLGEVNYGMAAASDLRRALSSPLLLFKQLRSSLCFEARGAGGGAPLLPQPGHRQRNAMPREI